MKELTDAELRTILYLLTKTKTKQDMKDTMQRFKTESLGLSSDAIKTYERLAKIQIKENQS